MIESLLPQFVKPTPLGTAGVGPEDVPLPAQAGALVDMAQGQIVQAAGGNVSRLANLLNVSRVTLYRYLKKYNLEKK